MYVFIQYKVQMFLASELMYLNGDMPWVLLEQRNIFINSMIDHILDSSGSVRFVKQLEHEGKIKSPNFLYPHFYVSFPISIQNHHLHVVLCGNGTASHICVWIQEFGCL